MEETLEGLSVVREALLQTFTDDPFNWIKWGVVFFVLIFSYRFSIPLYGKVQYRLSWERKRDMAKSRGHTLQAEIKSYWRERGEGHYTYHAVYLYQREGEEKEYRAIFHHTPPRILYLYYLDNPRRLFSVSEYHWENHKVIILVPVMALPWLLAVLTMFLLGAESGI